MTNSPERPDEKRVEPRAPIELKVEYRRLNTFFADYTKNISKGGTFIKTRKPLKIGTEFVFKLFIPSLDEPIALNGKVQWIVNPGEEESGEPPGMGIKFEYEGIQGQKKKKQVETTVEKLIVDSLGRHLYNKLLRKSSSEPAP
ncbi:MAG: TIGR02266 family protein [Proteobacteria bacterium]|nr:TIGR02266 family protein [Pseudomonadota bacterium]